MKHGSSPHRHYFHKLTIGVTKWAGVDAYGYIHLSERVCDGSQGCPNSKICLCDRCREMRGWKVRP